MAIPNPTPILRLIHIDNLSVCLQRGALYAPNSEPEDGLEYRTIHNTEIQAEREARAIPCGPGGVAHDYVPFYFGYLSPMMFQLKTGRVEGYTEGQKPLIYLETTAQAIRDAGCGFVFSNGHGIAKFTGWFDALEQLDEVDWDMVYQRYWSDNLEDPDRQRRKQAELLVHESCHWSLIDQIVVGFQSVKQQVEAIMEDVEPALQRPVVVRRDWYYH